ncbi:hypothetical protein HPB50_003005 [Hyalomma asiaticum]|uniref:Uncharacterized protein n=1 Tax=Hyalomma asiaticum TaxID=266040 RepID=A0ACB7T171_HYAAI|nr:hypothetical protein HPB50_003005 [Hyalomma asiaticum]
MISLLHDAVMHDGRLLPSYQARRTRFLRRRLSTVETSWGLRRRLFFACYSNRGPSSACTNGYPLQDANRRLLSAQRRSILLLRGTMDVRNTVHKIFNSDGKVAGFANFRLLEESVAGHLAKDCSRSTSHCQTAGLGIE